MHLSSPSPSPGASSSKECDTCIKKRRACIPGRRGGACETCARQRIRCSLASRRTAPLAKGADAVGVTKRPSMRMLAKDVAALRKDLSAIRQEVRAGYVVVREADT